LHHIKGNYTQSAAGTLQLLLAGAAAGQYDVQSSSQSIVRLILLPSDFFFNPELGIREA
jgi:hypothetical protein